MKPKTPGFFIVGAARCGTTALSKYLNEHPEVCMSSVKEPHFFSGVKAPGYVADWNEYTRLFSGASEGDLCGEASVTYLPYYKKSIEGITTRLGNDVKIVIVLRNPAERAFSHYLYYRKLGFEKNSFSDVLSPDYRLTNDPWGAFFNPYIYPGLYSEQVEAYMKVFPKTQVILFDELTGKPQETTGKLCDFLSIRHVDIEYRKANVSGIPRFGFVGYLIKRNFMKMFGSYIPAVLKKTLRSILLAKPTMSNKDRDRLRRTYRDDVARLSAIIGANLDHWT